MKKKTVLYLLTLLGLTLASCNPVFNDDSSVEPSSQDSSGQPSSSETSEGSDSSEEKHTHVKDDSVWRYDETKHWYDCIAHDDYRFDEADHSFVDEVVSPTYERGGYTRHTCSVCGYSFTDTPTDKLEHHYEDTYTYDETKHWRKCIDEGYESLVTDEANHDYLEEVIPPTENENGYTRHTCKVCGYYFDDSYTDPTGDHEYSTEWSYDEHYHWHACIAHTNCPAESNKGAHSDANPEYVEDIDLANYIKGRNKYTCDVCGHVYKEEIVKYTKIEMCDLMNDFIGDTSYFDLFEIKQVLIDNGYPIVDNDSAEEYFGYDTSLKKVAISNGTSVSYPLGASINNFVSFKETVVTDQNSFESAIVAINSGTKQYSSIKLGTDISVTSPLILNGSYPVEINLSNHILDNIQDSGSAIRVSKVNEIKPTVAVINGTIRTKNIDGNDFSKSPSCISLIDATSLRINNVHMINRAEKGYGFIDYPDYRTNASVKITNSTIDSKIVAVCIQTNINIIDNNTINGVVVINGGDTTFTNNIVDASLVQSGLDNEANRLITCAELYQACQDYYIEGELNTYMLTATDAVLIYDRRSQSGTYSNPTVYLKDNTLKCKVGAGDTPYGYGIRYMDLKFDATKDSNAYDLGLIEILDNTYSYCTESSPYNVAGGYMLWEASE